MKMSRSSDWGLQPDPMKLDSLVIAHQPWRGEYVPGPWLSRNKVAVPEGAAGTPPFWRGCPIENWELGIENYDMYLSFGFRFRFRILWFVWTFFVDGIISFLCIYV